MADTTKRKSGPGDDRDNKNGKRSKGGAGGKWQTPHQKSKASTPRGGGKIEPGDAGIWATCMKSKEGKATEELKSLFEQSAEKFYNISSAPDEEDGEEDIEASIRKEIDGIAANKSAVKLFQPVFLDVQCVLFFKTQQPIDPVAFVHAICDDAAKNLRGRKHRFLNRLTPMTRMGRATEKDLEELARQVLGKEFRLVGAQGEEEGEDKGGEAACSYAIRPSIRNHSALKRSVIIDTIANLIDKSHKVSLTNPDKVIIVEFYQNICGLSVVGGSDWETLKRYNLNEIYLPTPKPVAAVAAEAEAETPSSALAAPEAAATDGPAAAQEEPVAGTAATAES